MILFYFTFALSGACDAGTFADVTCGLDSMLIVFDKCALQEYGTLDIRVSINKIENLKDIHPLCLF